MDKIKKILAHAVPAVVSISIAVGIISLVSCGQTESHAASDAPDIASFTDLGSPTLYSGVYRHDVTGVLYLFDARGGWCVMVNADGSPLVWEGR